MSAYTKYTEYASWTLLCRWRKLCRLRLRSVLACDLAKDLLLMGHGTSVPRSKRVGLRACIGASFIDSGLPSLSVPKGENVITQS